MNKPLCIYHANCFDGFAAAWVVWDFFKGEVDMHPGVYGEPPPDVTDRVVYIVDFSYNKLAMTQLALRAERVTLLDHHKSAKEELDGWASPGAADTFIEFDMERSGAGMAWDYFRQDQPRPLPIEYIEDRDLWRFKYPATRAVHAGLSSYHFDFEEFDRLVSLDTAGIEHLAEEGQAILRKHHRDLDELLPVVRREMWIGGFYVPVANLPATMCSDAGHRLAAKRAFAACYWDTPKGRQFSLRSDDKGTDVSAIAKIYGGGGHYHAAGFTVPLGWEGDHE